MKPALYDKYAYMDERARLYAVRKPAEAGGEDRLVERMARRIRPVTSVLDAPCGAGRFTRWFQHRVPRVTAADISPEMVRLCRDYCAGQVQCVQADLEHLCFPDQSFELVFCFRLFHHLPTDPLRDQIVGELCRVSARYVAMSYHHWLNPTTLRRWCRHRLRGKRPNRFTNSRAHVERFFQRRGFRLVTEVVRMPLVHTLRIAVFERTESRAGLAASPHGRLPAEASFGLAHRKHGPGHHHQPVTRGSSQSQLHTGADAGGH